MLRETRARLLASASAALVVALAALFALLRNPADSAAARSPADDGRLEAAMQAFERLGCAGCHSIGGRGNPDSPLDGIGARLDRAAIRDWATAGGATRDELPGSIARRKARVADDPELDALVEALAASR